jgi:FkbM family methyltransferase
MGDRLRRLAAKTPLLGRALRAIEKRVVYRGMCREYGAEFRNHHIGRIDAFGRTFPFCSPTGEYLRDSFRGRVYEPGVCAHLIDRVRGRPVCFVDIGAHYGFFSCLVAGLHAGNRVHAFEPGPMALDVLKKNFALNEVRGGVWGLALSDEASTAPFLGVSMKVRADETATRVATETYDAWQARAGESPDVVKIDVHGSEGRVLFGMQDALRHGRFGLYLELHPQELIVGHSLAEIVELLLDSGFEMREMRAFRRSRDHELVPVDAAMRATVGNSDLWTAEERRSRRMFLCEKPGRG